MKISLKSMAAAIGLSQLLKPLDQPLPKRKVLRSLNGLLQSHRQELRVNQFCSSEWAQGWSSCMGDGSKKQPASRKEQTPPPQPAPISFPVTSRSPSKIMYNHFPTTSQSLPNLSNPFSITQPLYNHFPITSQFLPNRFPIASQFLPNRFPIAFQSLPNCI